VLCVLWWCCDFLLGISILVEKPLILKLTEWMYYVVKCINSSVLAIFVGRGTRILIHTDHFSL
jgi:hypothetical protein